MTRECTAARFVTSKASTAEKATHVTGAGSRYTATPSSAVSTRCTAAEDSWTSASAKESDNQP